MSRINLFSILLLGGFALSIVSCEKGNQEAPIQETSSLTSEKRLSFESESDFHAALQKFSDTEEVSFDYKKDILKWEEQQDFVSMRRHYEHLLEKFDNLSSGEEVVRFAEAYPDWVVFLGESYYVDPPMSLGLMNLLAPDGTVEIAGALYKYTPSRIYIIIDKDEKKLEQAVNSGVSDTENGIYVINEWRKTEVEFRTCSQTTRTRACTSPEISEKRVRGNWEVFLGATPNRNVYGQITGWTISYLWDIRIKGERRNTFNSWRSNATRLGFVSGFGVFSGIFGTTNTGTGWVVGSNVSSIDHTFIVQGPTTFSGAQLPAGVNNFHITYCTCGAKDANVAPSGGSGGIFCYECCPWDCSDLDWNDIQ